MSIIISTSIESSPPPFRDASQSSQFEAWNKDGTATVASDDEAEELLDGEDCRADGMPQNECKLDC